MKIRRSGVVAVNNSELYRRIRALASFRKPIGETASVLLLASGLAFLVTTNEPVALGVITTPRAIEEVHAPQIAVPTRYLPTIRMAATLYNVPSDLLVALIDQETNGTWASSIVSKNPNGTYDIGLAQANSAYLDYFAWRFGLTNPRDAEQSIMFAARYTRYLYEHTDSWYIAMLAYKCGLNGWQYANAEVHHVVATIVDGVQ